MQKKASSSFAISGTGDSRTIISKRSLSSDKETRDSSVEYFFSNPGDLFYIPTSQQKVVNISNLPAELQELHQSKAINSLDSHAEQQRKFIEELLYEDETLSNTLHGADPPHYRTDSVEFHWAPASFSKDHNKTLSQDFHNKHSEHIRKQHSSYEAFVVNTPPGFGM